MINIVIKKLMSKTEKMSFNEKVLLIFLMFLIATPLVFLFLFVFEKNINKVLWGFISLITAAAIPIVLFLLERKRIKGVMNYYFDYNNKLNIMRDVLKDFTYDNNGTQCDWYSKRKIHYLINECNKILDENSSNKSQNKDFLKFLIFPFITFVAGVITDKASIEMALSLAVVALGITLSIWGIIQIVEFLGDITLKSSSISTIRSVRDKLKDLLARDFESEENCDE